jgi:6-phosphofructokinase
MHRKVCTGGGCSGLNAVIASLLAATNLWEVVGIRTATMASLLEQYIGGLIL